MQEYIALDVHKHYTFAEREVKSSGKTRRCRIEHRRGAIAKYLRNTEADTPVAVEATGNWYWVVDEIESTGCQPALINPYKAKVMFGCINKTDKLDVHGMNRLQRSGTLPVVWIPPSELRDLRELPRGRMFLVRERTRLKNRIQAQMTKYALNVTGFSDPFGVEARKEMTRNLQQLPTWTRKTTEDLLKQLEEVENRIDKQEQQIAELIRVTPEIQRIMSMPGVGQILATVIALEVGDSKRFASAAHLASYSGTTPRIHASGDKIRYGRLRQDVNHYLKWAFIEAASCICRHQRNYAGRHVVVLYQRIAQRRGHKKALGAVARHLAEATYYILSRQENYRERVQSIGT